jgi:hypothetical protein
LLAEKELDILGLRTPYQKVLTRLQQREADGGSKLTKGLFSGGNLARYLLLSCQGQ